MDGDDEGGNDDKDPDHREDPRKIITGTERLRPVPEDWVPASSLQCPGPSAWWGTGSHGCCP